MTELSELHEAGKRISDVVNLHLTAHRNMTDTLENVVGKWCVFALSDGKSDNVLYDTKDDAVTAMRGRSKDHCYLKITPDGITPFDAERYLQINRHPMVDTIAPEHVIGPQIFPRFSNLTAAQRAELKARAEREFRGQSNPAP